MANTQSSYSQKLRSPKWQRKRLQIFERDNWKCKSCGSGDNNLQVHHLKYTPGKEPWEYEDHLLVTYCDICHETEHMIGDSIRVSLIELIRETPIYIKPVSQLCVLIESDPAFYDRLKAFLNDAMILHLQNLSKAA